MAEYIKRDDVIRVVNGKSSLTMTRSGLIDSIINLPAADVAPVVHGRWIHDGCRIEGGIDWCHCSEYWKSDDFCARTNYCPKCGAKMDGGDGDEANKCVVGGYHEWVLSTIGSDGIGNEVDTYQCRKCGETFKIKFEEP